MSDYRQSDWRKSHIEHCRQYRVDVRRTMRRFSDQALRFQDSIIHGGIDREECDREIMRRQNGGTRDAI